MVALALCDKVAGMLSAVPTPVFSLCFSLLRTDSVSPSSINQTNESHPKYRDDILLHPGGLASSSLQIPKCDERSSKHSSWSLECPPVRGQGGRRDKASLFLSVRPFQLPGRPPMETFPQERNKISLVRSEQQQNVPLDREQLLETWESERLDCIQRECPQSDREPVLGAQQHSTLNGEQFPVPRPGVGAGYPRN